MADAVADARRRTTDEREQRVTEQCQFDSSDAENSSRILNALCAYGRSKYDARPRWLAHLARHEIDQVLNTLATADEEAARVVQQKYAVSDADMDVTRQWLTRVSAEGSTARVVCERSPRHGGRGEASEHC